MLERHHLVFRSQGGLDFPLNYRYLTASAHRGNLGPHMDRSIDLKYKKELELNLRKILGEKRYNKDELVQLLGLDKKQAEKAFKKVYDNGSGMDKELIIKRLMGGRFYL